MRQLWEDRYGLTFTTGSRAAATAYLQAQDLLLAADAGALEALDRAVGEDPAFALAHVARGRALQIAGAGADAQAAARHALALSRELAARERSHVEALGAVVLGAPDALAAVRRHVDGWPRDALVLAPAVAVFGLIGFSGRTDRNAALFDWMAALAPAYGEDWWFGAWYGFLHTETGRFEEGLRRVERAFAANPRNANAAHAVAHALYERGEADAGARFLSAWLPGYARAAPLHCHLSWHRALAELEAGRPDRVWEIFDDAIRPAGSPQAPAINTLTDSASLLWRAELAGEPTPAGAWEEARDFARRRFPPGAVPFVDVHAAMVYARTADEALLRETHGRAGALGPGGDLAVAVIAALDAFARGDWAQVIAALAPRGDELIAVGGSGAQRDVFEQTLLAAFRRAGRAPEADAWLTSRPPRPRSATTLRQLA